MRNIILFSLLLTLNFAPNVLGATPAALGVTKDKVSMIIISSHTRTFGVDDIYKAPIDYTPWTDVIKATSDFVFSNAKNDMKLKIPFDTVVSQNNLLMKTINEAYASVKKGLTQKDFDQYNKTFSQIGEQTSKIEKQLKATAFMIDSAPVAGKGATAKGGTKFPDVSKNNARDITVQFAMFVGTTAKAASSHLQKKLPNAGKKASVLQFLRKK